MDPLDVNFLPPPAYSAQEFDQKTSRATELSLELAKWERPKVDVDEEGFPRYDPAMFEEPTRAQKGKEQPTATTFRSSSISKRPLPNPKSSTSSTDAGPSTRRQTQPLHISKRSISKAEEAAREATRNIPTSSQQSIPNQSNYTSEDIPPYAAQDLSVSTPSLQSGPNQSIEDTSEDNPPYTARNPHSGLQSIPNQSIEDTPENNEDNPPYEPNYPAEPPYDEQPVENWEEDSTTPRQELISEPVPIDRPQSAEPELPEHSTHGRELLNPNVATMANQMLDTQSQYSIAHNPPFHHGQVNPNTTMSNQHDMQSLSMAPTPSFHRGSQLNHSTGTMSNQMLDLQSQYFIAPNPPVHRGPQHFSLPPAPRNLPRINPSDRPRSTLSQPATPRVLFNPNVAYGKHAMGGPVPQFRPKVQTPQTPQTQAHFDPHMFYNSAVSSQMNTQMTMPDQSPHLSHQVQRSQVWPSQSYSSPGSSAVNQPRQWGWHPPGRPSNTYGSVSDTSYGGGGTDVSRYSMTNNGYFNQ